MKAKITSYSFIRTKNGAKFFKGDAMYEITSEALECLIRQYQLMGFRIIFDNECFVSVSRVENEIDLLFDKLNNK